MNGNRLLVALFLTGQIVGCALEARSEPGEFALVVNGKPNCAILVSDPPSPAARLAALEIQFHILKITGTEIPIRDQGVEVEGGRILVGDSPRTRALGLRAEEFSPQEYLISVRPDTVVLMGRDWVDSEENRKKPGRPISGGTLAELRHRIDYWKAVGFPERSAGEMELPGLFDDQGTCYAAHDFLERLCGVRWYGPSALNMVAPRASSLSVPAFEVRRSPGLRHRDGLSRGNWPFLRGQWGPRDEQEMNLWLRRMRVGGEKWSANHTIHRQTIATLLNSPEYQAWGDARGMNLCYTNPKLVETIARMARDGPAGGPMRAFYLMLETIACDQANYPPHDHRQTEEIAWNNLGTPERMEQLGALMDQATALAQTNEEKKRVELWREALWKWMVEGRAAALK